MIFFAMHQLFALITNHSKFAIMSEFTFNITLHGSKSNQLPSQFIA